MIDKYCNKLYSGTIILLSNVYNRTKIYSNKSPNIQSEFFDENELNTILTALKQSGYTVLCYFDENKFIKDYLDDKILAKEYIVFNLARNGYGIGKKSLIPTFCDLNSIKYTASDGYSCSFARHKYHVNCLLNELGFKSLKTYLFTDGTWLSNQKPDDFSIKYIVKPLNESASQGISKKSIFDGNNFEQLEKFVEQIYLQMNKIPLIIQQFIEGYEAKTTIIDFDSPYIFEPVGVEIDNIKNLKDLIITEEIAFTYKHRNYLLKNELGDNISNYIKDKSLLIYKAIGMKNYGRIDCRIDNKTNDVYFMDFSTMPYFVSDGEMLYSFKLLGYGLCHLLNAIINSALITKYNYSL